MKKIFVLALALTVNVCAFAYEPLWQSLNKTFTVKGGVGIEQFVYALGIFEPEYTEAENFDKKNGYFSSYEEGDGHFSFDACYWNRSDGKKLFIVSYHCASYETDTDYESVVSPWGFCNMMDIQDDHGYIYDTGCIAYLYDAAKKQLVPMKSLPFNGLNLEERKHYSLK